MRREIEQARARATDTERLAEQAGEARRELAKYATRPRGYETPRSHARLRDLEFARDLAETRLRMAQTDSPRQA